MSGGSGQGQHGQGPPGNNNDSYNGPDSLRNTANKMFNRNNQDRLSGYNNNGQQQQQHPMQGQYQNNFHQYQQQQQQPPQLLNQSLNQSHHSLNHSMDMSSQNYNRGRQNSDADDPAKRNSYTNQSFRNAIQSPPGQQAQPPPKPGHQSQRLPPQVKFCI